MKGTVSHVQSVIRDDRLKVLARIRTPEGEIHDAFMPDRELAAILPRTILLGGSSKAPLAMLSTIEPIVSRMTEGRAVRLWKYQERFYFSFMPWKSVRFVKDDEKLPPKS